MAVELTEEQKKSPLMKYYNRDIAGVEPELMARVMTEQFNPADGIPFDQKDRLFDDGYLSDEFGVFPLGDGVFEVGNLTKMPGVTPDMIDFWFAWHGVEPMRYIIWDKDDHYYCQSQNLDIALNKNLSLRERYWETTHDVSEALLDGQEPLRIPINFVSPVKFGFDPDKCAKFEGTIICAGRMVHMARPVEGGIELRTRFWFDMPNAEMVARATLAHCIKEYRHLAKILPEIYAEYKDTF